MTYRSLRRRALFVACASIVVGAAGCGLVTSDTMTYDLTLPDKMFTVDASGWAVDGSGAAAYLTKSCAAVPTLCQTAAATACSNAGTCSGECGANDTCELALEISLWRQVNLVTEKPDLKTISNEPMLDVTIDSVTYDVADNSLNIDTPALTVYVAPSTVMAPSDAAMAIGTISIVAAGTTSAAQQVELTATGKADLSAAMSTYQTPFNVLIGSTVTVGAGDVVPTGKLDAIVHIAAHAGL